MNTRKLITLIPGFLSYGLALFFFFTGATKLAGMDVYLDNFIQLGLPLWLLYVTGVFETTGALLLLIPSGRFYGALLLSGTMGGAVFTQIIAGQFIMALVPLVFLLLSLTVTWFTRPQWLITFLCDHSLTRPLQSCE